MKKILFGLLFLGLIFLVGCEPTEEITEPQEEPSITVSEESIEIFVDQEKEMTVTVSESTSTYEYTITDQTVVSVDGDVFTGLKAGTTTVIVKLVDAPEVTKTFTITVKAKPMLVSITIDGNVEMELDTTQTLTAVVAPLGADKDVEWSVSDETVISITEDGVITALEFGTVVIIAQSKSNSRIRGTIEIEVVKPSPTEVSVTGESAVLVEKKILLAAAVLPIEAAQEVNWSVDNAMVASIDALGELTGLRTGVVVVTAATKVNNTVLGTFTVTVNGPDYIEVRAENETGVMEVEQEITMDVNVYPLELADKSVTWSSSNPEIATVSQTGEVTALAVGSVLISATLNANSEIIGTYGLSVLPKTQAVDPLEFILRANTPEPFIQEIVTYGANDYEVGGANVRATIISSVSKLFGADHEVRVEYMPNYANHSNLAGINYITIHDTGNTSGTATAQGHVNFLASLPGVSWHYTVDEKEIVQHLPDAKRGSHAGNSTGNNESIGIEMAVNFRADHYRTWQRSARLVAELLVKHNLGLNKVRQHNDWSGKDCPRTLRNAGLYPMFTELIRFEYERLTTYSEYEFEFISHNTEIVSNEGRVINRPLLTTTVSYTVNVTKPGTDYSESITLYSTIPGRLAY